MSRNLITPTKNGQEIEKHLSNINMEYWHFDYRVRETK